MDEKYLTNASKFISLVLRHKPEEAGLELTKDGYANVEELIKGMYKAGFFITKKELEHIVDTDSKQRYSFNSDKTMIKANQGHSIKVEVHLEESEPPSILYHGTSLRVLDSIKAEGIKPMSRLYVHLSKDEQTAYTVGKRHGKPIVLQIDCKKMRSNSIKFYLSDNNIWLTKYIDPKYILNIKEINNEKK